MFFDINNVMINAVYAALNRLMMLDLLIFNLYQAILAKGMYPDGIWGR